MSYEVGYGKPPKEYQFPKGVSGNPGGRRKKPKVRDGAIALLKAITEVLDQKIEIKEKGKIRKIEVRKAAITKLAHKALSEGDIKALYQLLKWAEKADRANFEGRTGEPLQVIIEGGLPDYDGPPPPECRITFDED